MSKVVVRAKISLASPFKPHLVSFLALLRWKIKVKHPATLGTVFCPLLCWLRSRLKPNQLQVGVAQFSQISLLEFTSAT